MSQDVPSDIYVCIYTYIYIIYVSLYQWLAGKQKVLMKFVGNAKLEWMMELENDPKIENHCFFSLIIRHTGTFNLRVYYVLLIVLCM